MTAAPNAEDESAATVEPPTASPTVESSFARVLRVSGCAAAGVVLIDLLDALRRGLPVSSLASAGAAGVGLLSAVTLPMAALVVLAWRQGSSRRGSESGGRGAERRSGLRLVVGGVAAVGALGAHLANTLWLPRLYLSVHVALSLITSFCAVLMVQVWLPVARTTSLGRPLLGALVVVLAALGGVSNIALDPALRFAALERTTETGQMLLSFEALTGVLSAAQPARLSEEVPTPRTLALPRGGNEGANLLLLTVDALRPDEELEAYARLTPRGTRFTRAYAPACWTLHSMAGLLTSRAPSQLDFEPVAVAPGPQFVPRDPRTLLGNPMAQRGITMTPLRDRTPTLAAVLREAGYRTLTVPSYVFYLRDAGLTREFEEVDEAAFVGTPIAQMGIGIMRVPLVERALTLLDEGSGAGEGRPFFLWLHFMEPHAPYEAHGDTPADASDRVRYRSEVRRVDAEIARLLDALQRRGELDDTVVVVHADHGEEFGEHGGRFHGSTVYDEQVRVPLVISGPGLATGVETTAVGLVDLAPTLLDILGVRTSLPMTGASFAGRLRGGSMPARPVVVECTRFGRDRVARIEWPIKRIVDRRMGTLEVYDLANDPGETTNLAGATR